MASESIAGIQADLGDISAQVDINDVVPRFVGNYSCVHQGIYRHGAMGVEELVAVKTILHVGGKSTEGMKRKFFRELSIWARIKSPNIVPIYGTAMKFGSFGSYISPWFNQGTLDQLLAKQGLHYTLEKKVALFQGVVQGLQCLHEWNPQIVHGDLKPNNILISDDNVPMIADFGLAREIMPDGENCGMTTTSWHTGTERYIAPELVESEMERLPTAASDVFSLGSVGLEVLFLRRPYSHRKSNRWHTISDDLRAGRPPANRPDSLPTGDLQLWLLLERCWIFEPKHRPSASFVLQSLNIWKEQQEKATMREVERRIDELGAMRNTVASAYAWF